MAGKVKMAPATTAPEQAPIDWMMTFSRRAFERLDNRNGNSSFENLSDLQSEVGSSCREKNGHEYTPGD